MLFIAPVISKSLVHHSDCVSSAITTAMPEHHGMAMSGMHHDMAMPEHCEQNLTMVHPMMAGHAMSPMEEIACGYCHLLIHLPFVQFVLTIMLWLMLLCVHLSLPLQAISHRFSAHRHLSVPAPLLLLFFLRINYSQKQT